MMDTNSGNGHLGEGDQAGYWSNYRSCPGDSHAGFHSIKCTDALHTYVYFTHTHTEKTSQEKPHKNQRNISDVLRNISFI